MSGDNRVAVALDVGGTFVKAGLVGPDGALVGEVTTFESYSDSAADTVLARFEEILRHMWARAGERPVAGIGVGMCGPLDYENGISLIQGLSKYDAIYGVNLKQDWRTRLQLPAEFPIHFVNDAAAFALSESLYGAGRGSSRVMAITLGTGCGGSFVVDGKVVTEGQGVPKGGEVYHLPFYGGTVEDWISRRGILRLWSEFAPNRPDMDVKDIADLARTGDKAATRMWDWFSALLARALGPVAEAFDPDVLVVGGQIARSMDLFGGPLEERLSRIGARLAVSADTQAGIRGAASLVWRG